MKTLLAILALVGVSVAQIPTVVLPNVFANDSAVKVRYVYENDTVLANRIIQIRDTVNSDSVKTVLKSLSNLRLTIDADANATGTCFAFTHNSAADSLVKFCDDSTSKFFGRLTITGKTTLTDSLIGVSQRMTGNLAVAGTITGSSSGTATRAFLASPASGDAVLSLNRQASTSGERLWNMAASASSLDFSTRADNDASGTIWMSVARTGTSATGVTITPATTVTGLNTAAGGLAVTGGTSAAGRITYDATNGVTVRGNTGSVYDFALKDRINGTVIMGNPTGTRGVTFPYADGIAVTWNATLGGIYLPSAQPTGILYMNDAGGSHDVVVDSSEIRYNGATSTFRTKNAEFNGSVSLSAVTTPTPGASGGPIRIYQTGSKIVFQYNDGGTTRYKYLDMSGTGVTWVHATAAP